jgi:ribosomal protein S11
VSFNNTNVTITDAAGNVLGNGGDVRVQGKP